MGSFPEMFNSFCGLWRWGLVMCAGSLYSYIQDYNRRESFSLKEKKQTNKQTNKQATTTTKKYIYIYSGPFTLRSRLKMTSRSCFLTGR